MYFKLKLSGVLGRRDYLFTLYGQHHNCKIFASQKKRIRQLGTGGLFRPSFLALIP